MVALHIAYLIANTYGGWLAWDEFYKVPYSQPMGTWFGAKWVHRRGSPPGPRQSFLAFTPENTWRLLFDSG